jgi:hypothetical protein
MNLDDFKFNFALDNYVCKNGHKKIYPCSMTAKDKLDEISGGMVLDGYVRLICEECGCLMRKSYEYTIPATEYTDKKIVEYQQIVKDIFLDSTNPYAIKIRLEKIEKDLNKLMAFLYNHKLSKDEKEDT